MKSQGFDDIFWHPNKWNLIKRNAKKHTSNRNPWSIHWNYAVCQCSGILHLLSLNLEKRRRESGKLFDVEKGHFPIPPPFKDNWQRHGGDSSKGIREWILSQCFIEQLYLQTFPFDTFQKWWKGPDQPSPHFESWYVIYQLQNKSWLEGRVGYPVSNLNHYNAIEKIVSLWFHPQFWPQKTSANKMLHIPLWQHKPLRNLTHPSLVPQELSPQVKNFIIGWCFKKSCDSLGRSLSHHDSFRQVFGSKFLRFFHGPKLSLLVTHSPKPTSIS